ncbi:MAG: hypothetical protein K8T25_01270 [Planctomycetia bacterium]|nr:hypothetical protein [Planctomycetia bacterium]
MEPLKSQVIEAEEYRLVDSNGKLRALITSSKTWDGEPSITLFDRQGCGRLTLELHNDAPRISCSTPSGQPLVAIGIHEEGGAVLGLNQDNGMPGLYVRVPSESDITIQVYDKDGQPKAPFR